MTDHKVTVTQRKQLQCTLTNQYILRMTLAQNRGGSRGGTWVARPPPLFLDQIEARRAPPIFFGAWAPPYLRV